MKLVKLERTCIACPSQWEGWTEDNRPVYIRYRGGNFRVFVAVPNADPWEAVLSVPPTHQKAIGGQYDGYMSDEVMIQELMDQGWEIELVNFNKADNYLEWENYENDVLPE